MRRLTACVAAIAVAASPVAAIEERFCKPSFYQIGGAQKVKDTSGASLAKVYVLGSSLDDDYRGNAFVIDAERGLLLTARHVVESAGTGASSRLVGREVSLSFHNMSRFSNYADDTATVIAVSPQVGGDDRFDKPRDFALLQLNYTGSLERSDLRQLRLSLETWSAETGFAISYVGKETAPQPGVGQILRERAGPEADARARECTRRLKYTTRGGDSGAPVISDTGEVVGLIVSDQPEGDEKFARFLPSHCMRSTLITWYETHFKADVDATKSALWADDRVVLGRKLAESAETASGLNNVLLHAALKSMRTELERQTGVDPNKVNFGFRHWYCPLSYALNGRVARLPEDEELGFVRSVTTHLAAFSNPAELGLLGNAAYEIATARNDPGAATVASFYYQGWAQQFGDLNQTIALAAVTDGVFDQPKTTAKLMHNWSKALTLQAELFDPSTDAWTNSLALSQRLSLQSALLAEDSAPEVAGNAAMTFANTAARSGDFAAAVDGYAVVAGGGLPVKTPQLKRAASDFDYAFTRRDNWRTLQTNPNYAAPEMFWKNKQVSPKQHLTDLYAASPSVDYGALASDGLIVADWNINIIPSQ